MAGGGGAHGEVVVSLAVIELRQWVILAFALDIAALVSSACSISASMASSLVASSILASNGVMS